jgi:hypothetical protein
VRVRPARGRIQVPPQLRDQRRDHQPCGANHQDRTIGPSVPLVRILRETWTLHAHDAEALSGWSLHHHPTFQAVHDVRAQLLKARNFGRGGSSLTSGFPGIALELPLIVHLA